MVEVSPEYFGPVEVDFLPGDVYKAKKKLGTKHKVGFEELVEIMVDTDLRINI